MWAKEYAFDDSKTLLTRGLFERRIASANTIQLTDDEVQQVRQMSKGDEGLKACRESLSEVGVAFP